MSGMGCLIGLSCFGRRLIGTGCEKARVPQALLDSQAFARRRSRRQIRKLSHVFDKEQMRPAQMNFVTRGQLTFTFQGFRVDAGAVEAVEVAQTPTAIGVID